jgi:hypothetical protein
MLLQIHMVIGEYLHLFEKRKPLNGRRLAVLYFFDRCQYFFGKQRVLRMWVSHQPAFFAILSFCLVVRFQ